MLSNAPERLRLGPEDKPRVYWLKRPVLHERANWRRATAACGGKFNGPDELLSIMADGVRQLMEGKPEEIVDALLAKIERQRERVLKWRESPRGDNEAAREMRDGMREIGTIESEVLAAYPAYASAVGDDAAYWQIAGIEAARLFLVRWEGFEIELRRTRAGVDDSCLAEIPEGDFAMIGMFADGLSRLREAERKNSNLPLATSSGGVTSNNSNGATNGPFPNSESSQRQDQSPN